MLFFLYRKEATAEIAEKRKEEGNSFFKTAAYPDALLCYEDAIRKFCLG